MLCARAYFHMVEGSLSRKRLPDCLKVGLRRMGWLEPIRPVAGKIDDDSFAASGDTLERAAQ